MFDQATILGTGLLGASLMRALRSHGLAKRIAAWSRRVETRLKCEGQPWCDAVYDNPHEAVADADLVVLCTPVEQIATLAGSIAPNLKTGALVTDVGSTKSLVTRRSHAAMPEYAAFVGSHPMAGSEKSGPEHSSETLFRNRMCLVTPLPETPPDALEKILRLWRGLDMRVATMSPERHDEIVAHISHLPHILASALCAYLSRKDPEWSAYAGGGLRDSTRIAAGDAGLWQSIVSENKAEILRALDGFELELQGFRRAIHNDQAPQLWRLLEDGRAFRQNLRVE